MLGTIRRDEGIGDSLAHMAVELVVLGHLVRGVVPVDVLPGLGVGEGQLVGRDAYNGAVRLVELPDREWKVTGDQAPEAPEGSSTGKKRARELP